MKKQYHQLQHLVPEEVNYKFHFQNIYKRYLYTLSNIMTETLSFQAGS